MVRQHFVLVLRNYPDSDRLGLDLGELISRAPGRAPGGNVDQWGLRKTSTFKVVGRHVLNLWRIMRSEQTLTMYSFENVVFNVLRRRYKYSVHERARLNLA